MFVDCSEASIHRNLVKFMFVLMGLVFDSWVNLKQRCEEDERELTVSDIEREASEVSAEMCTVV